MASVKPGNVEVTVTRMLLAREFPHYRHQFVNRLLPFARFYGPLHAAVRMVFQQHHGYSVQRGLQCGDLVKDIDAVAVFQYHLVDASYLSLDAVEALDQGFLSGLHHCGGFRSQPSPRWRLQSPHP